MKLVGLYFITAMGGLLFYQLVVITTLAKVFAGLSPARFYRGIRTLIVTAFSTSSSNATMPTTIRTAVDEFGAPKEIAGFVMPLGATMNMNGTALFEGVSVLFLAQVYGAELDRLVDMTRTIPNVSSDLVCSLWLSRREGHKLKA